MLTGAVASENQLARRGPEEGEIQERHAGRTNQVSRKPLVNRLIGVVPQNQTSAAE